MKYEGHFLLWYLILFPFAKLGFPYITTNIISFIITGIAVWLILDKAPFKFYIRVLIIFTFPLLYLFPVISRCYCLIPLAIVLMCMFYKDRKEKPLRYLMSVLLLANTHVIMLGMVGIVILEYIIEYILDFKNISEIDKKKRVKSFFIFIILLLITMLPIAAGLSTNKEVGTSGTFGDKLKLAIFYHPWVLITYSFGVSIKLIGWIVFLVLVILIFEIRNNPVSVLKFLICIMWQCFIEAFIYSSSSQRVATIIFIVLFFKWIETYTKHKNNKKIENIVREVLWGIVLLTNVFSGILNVLYLDLCCDFSNAYKIGEYINEKIEDGSIILNGPKAEFTSSVIPYVKKNIKFYQMSGDRYFSYAIWDEKNQKDVEVEEFKKLQNKFEKSQKLYYIFSIEKFKKNKDNEYHEDELIDELIREGVLEELYYVYTVNQGYESYALFEVNLDNLK